MSQLTAVYRLSLYFISVTASTSTGRVSDVLYTEEATAVGWIYMYSKAMLVYELVSKWLLVQQKVGLRLGVGSG